MKRRSFVMLMVGLVVVLCGGVTLLFLPTVLSSLTFLPVAFGMIGMPDQAKSGEWILYSCETQSLDAPNFGTCLIRPDASGATPGATAISLEHCRKLEAWSQRRAAIPKSAPRESNSNALYRYDSFA